MRRAEPQGLLAAPVDRVDGDDRLGAGDPRALDDELADAARADDEHRRAGLHAGGEDDRADTGERRTAEERGLAQRNPSCDRQGHSLGHDDALGEAAGRRAAVDGLAAAGRGPSSRRRACRRRSPGAAGRRRRAARDGSRRTRRRTAPRRARPRLPARARERGPRPPRRRPRPRARGPSASAARTRP